jgi:hypothetical protein
VGDAVGSVSERPVPIGAEPPLEPGAGSVELVRGYGTEGETTRLDDGFGTEVSVKPADPLPVGP